MDEYLKRLDEQIAKLEEAQKEEERLEQEKFEKQNKSSDQIISIEDNSTENKVDIQNEIENILDHKADKPAINVNIENNTTVDNKDNINPYVANEPVKTEQSPKITTEPTYEEI